MAAAPDPENLPWPPENWVEGIVLAPCPMCGSDAEPFYGVLPPEDPAPDTTFSAPAALPFYGVACTCGVEISYQAGHNTPAAAAEHWNTRPPQQHVKENGQ